MPRNSKSVHFDLPIPLWEEFTKLFPAVGEKSAFFRKVCELAVEYGEEKESFIKLLFSDMKEEATWYSSFGINTNLRGKNE